MPTTGDPLPPRSDREAELIAAAASEQLTGEEGEEYAALVAADPTIGAEATELHALLEQVDQVGTWQDPEPRPDLARRILAIPHARPPRTRGRVTVRRVLPGLAAAVLLVVLGGLGGNALAQWRDRPPDGPPGTLGAVEPIDFEGAPTGVEIEASLVAHTWGTETVLDMDGWEPGDRFQVVLVGTDGTVQDSGSFLGSQVEIACRLNASLLREQVGAVEIRDAGGTVVASSDVPSVSA